MIKHKLIRLTTVPISLEKLIVGQLKFMQSYFQVIAVASEKEKLMELGNENGYEVFFVEITRKITLIADLKAVYKLFIFFRREKPTIVHTHTPKAGTLGMLAAWLCHVPVRIHTVAGLPLMESQGAKRTLLNVVEKVTYACATKVYPNSFGLKNIILENRFCKPSKLQVIGNGSSNGIDTDHFCRESIQPTLVSELRLRFSIKSNDFVFIFIGRLVKDKGINELVQAFKEINTKYTSTKLILVGHFEADLDPLAPETIKEIETNKSIIFAGYQSDVRPYIAISHSLVFPSYREGFPNVPMQALAMEVPAIVTDINGCNEIVIHEQNGLIIPPKNTQAIEDAMERLIFDKELYHHLKSNARESIVSRYEQLTLWQLIKEEYDNQLKLAGVV